VRTRPLRRLPPGSGPLIKIAAEPRVRAGLPAHARASGPTPSQRRPGLRL